MTKVSELHQKWMKESTYRDDYEKLGAEFEFARALIEARVQAGLTQAELAKRMKTTESVVARMEGGHVRPSTRTLERFAQATGTRLKISFEPIEASS